MIDSIYLYIEDILWTKTTGTLNSLRLKIKKMRLGILVWLKKSRRRPRKKKRKMLKIAGLSKSQLNPKKEERVVDADRELQQLNKKLQLLNPLLKNSNPINIINLHGMFRISPRNKANPQEAEEIGENNRKGEGGGIEEKMKVGVGEIEGRNKEEEGEEVIAKAKKTIEIIEELEIMIGTIVIMKMEANREEEDIEGTIEVVIEGVIEDRGVGIEEDGTGITEVEIEKEGIEEIGEEIEVVGGEVTGEALGTTTNKAKLIKKPSLSSRPKTKRLLLKLEDVGPNAIYTFSEPAFAPLLEKCKTSSANFS